MDWLGRIETSYIMEDHRDGNVYRLLCYQRWNEKGTETLFFHWYWIPETDKPWCHCFRIARLWGRIIKATALKYLCWKSQQTSLFLKINVIVFWRLNQIEPSSEYVPNMMILHIIVLQDRKLWPVPVLGETISKQFYTRAPQSIFLITRAIVWDRPLGVCWVSLVTVECSQPEPNLSNSFLYLLL